MVEGKDRKPKVFEVQHRKTKRQQSEFDSVSVPLRHLPENLSGIRVTCPSCGTLSFPDWFKKHEMSMAPVKPRFETNGVEYTGPKRWILHCISQKCSNCEADIIIKLPVNKMRAKGSLFGDDAQREYKGKRVYIYSLVGADQSLLPQFEMKVKALKQSLLPSISAESWKIHMKEMWAGNSRSKHRIFHSLAFRDITHFADELLALTKKSNIFIYNIALTTGQGSSVGASQDALRNEAYIMLVMNAIDEWTTKNAQPHIFFDSEKDSKANEIIHGWARDTFKGSQYSLLYGFLSKGIEIPEPKFVPPASFPGLEVADFVSFTIARYYHRRWEGKDIEIDPAQMGITTYLGYDFNGDLLWKRQEGYPWDYFWVS